MENRFADALKMTDEEQEIAKAYTMASLALSKELAAKGAAGVELTEAESTFMKSAVRFHMHVLVASFK